MSLKAKIRNIAAKNNASPQATLVMYMFERILMRIEISEYKDNFILKGGLLLSSLIGIDMRTTYDMDTNITGLSLDKEIIESVVNKILSINLNDNIIFEIVNVFDIRKKDKYNAFTIEIKAIYENMIVPLGIDISTGDVITPKEMKYKYKKVFEEGYINILSYNIETIIAEKFETIITRGTSNTRAKDFYDLYMLVKSRRELDNDLLVKAIENTFYARNTEKYFINMKRIYEDLEKSQNLFERWNAYITTNPFSKNINYKELMSSIYQIIEILDNALIEV